MRQRFAILLVALGWIQAQVVVGDTDNRLPAGALRQFGKQTIAAGVTFDLAWSSKAKLLATAGYDIRLYELDTRKEVGRFHAPQKEAFFRVCLSADGTVLLGYTLRGDVHVWDRCTEKLLVTLALGPQNRVAVSPNGKRLAVAGGIGVVSLWSLPEGKKLVEWQRHRDFLPRAQPPQKQDDLVMHIANLAFSPDGNYLLSGGSTGPLLLWNMATLKEERTLEGLFFRPGGIAFSADSRRVAVSGGSGDNSIATFVWDVRDGKILSKIELPEAHAHRLAFSNDGLLLAMGGSYCRAYVWDFELRKLTFTSPRLSTSIAGLAFPPGDKQLFCLSSNVSLFDLKTGRDVLLPEAHTAVIGALAFAPDGATIASGGRDCTVRLWDVATGKQLHLLQGHEGQINGVAFSPDGKTLASCGEDSWVRIWDVATGKPLHVWTRPDKDHRPFYQLAFLDDGKTLAVSSDNLAVLFWDVPSRTLTRRLIGYDGFGGGSFNPLSFSRDRNTMASCAGAGPGAKRPLQADGQPQVPGPVFSYWIEVSETATGKTLQKIGRLQGPAPLALAPDGKTLLGFDHEYRPTLWKVASGKVEKQWPKGPAGPVQFSPDGEHFLIGNHLFWQIAKKAPVELPIRDVQAVAFSPDGLRFVTSSIDRSTFLLWDLKHWQQEKP